MPLLLLFYITFGKNPNLFVMAALIFGFLGDVFLLPENKNWCFLAGILSFMLGHIFYITSFIKILGTMNKMPLWYFVLVLPYLLYGICAFKIVGKLYLKDEISRDKKDWIESLTYWSRAAAKTKASMPSVARMEQIKNRVISMIPRPNEFNNGFKDLDNIDTLRI